MKPFLSVLGIPALGIGALIFSQGHPKISDQPVLLAQPTILLLRPDPKLDQSRIICLRQQAKAVACWRQHAHAARLAQAVSDYNLVARECTPAVFRSAHLPPSMTNEGGIVPVRL